MPIQKVVSPKVTHKTALELARQLGVRKLRLPSVYNAEGKTILNWGHATALSQNYQVDENTVIINPPEAVAIASNKVSTLQALEGDYTVDFTTDINQARLWLEEGLIVIERMILSGNSGRGINILREGDTPSPEARLWTRYFNGRYEFRLHCGKMADGHYDVFDIQRKGRSTDVVGGENQGIVRNHDNGYVFVRGEGDVIPSSFNTEAGLRLRAVCCLAVQQLGLDFGAVDIRTSAAGSVMKILEVNTAPGLTGTTLNNYVNYLSNNF